MLGNEPRSPASTAVRTEVQPLSVSVPTPESSGPDGGRHACRNKHDPKGYDERCIERVLVGSQMVRRLVPASVAEAAARAALLDCARCFIMFLG